MEEKQDLDWLKASDFGSDGTLNVTITGLRKERNAKGLTDKILSVMLPNGELREMSVWGGRWNFLIYHFLPDSSKWIGKKFSIRSEIVEWKDGQQKRVHTFFGAN